MSFFSSMKAERLIAEIKSSGNPESPETQKALAKLASMGAGAIEPILQVLPNADKKETLAYVEVLSSLVDAKTFPLFAKGLTDSNPRAAAVIGWALSSSRNFPPGLLLELLSRLGVAKPVA